MTAADDLAAELRRLCFDVQNPHRFQEAKRDLAARIARIALPSPCAKCQAASLRHSIEATPRTARAERDRAKRSERLLAGAVRRTADRERKKEGASAGVVGNMLHSNHGANEP